MGRRAFGDGEAAEVLKALRCDPSAAWAAGAVLAAAVAATSPSAATGAIKHHMRALGTNNDELARLLGKDPTTVRKWVREPRRLKANAKGEVLRASMLCAALAFVGRIDGDTPADWATPAGVARALAAAMPSDPPKDEAGDEARRRLSAAVAARCRTMPLESLAALAEVAKQLDAPRPDFW